MHFYTLGGKRRELVLAPPGSKAKIGYTEKVTTVFNTQLMPTQTTIGIRDTTAGLQTPSVALTSVPNALSKTSSTPPSSTNTNAMSPKTSA